MNRVSNPLLMILPEEALGSALALMIVVGGLMILIGARRLGGSLVVLAVSMPLIAVVMEAVFNDFFDALPARLVQPMAWLIMITFYVALGYMLLKFVVGQKAIDAAKGQLLADAVRGLLRLMFRWQLMLLWVPALAYMVWQAG